jgi:hypothetical protein
MTDRGERARIGFRFEISLDINRIWYSGLFPPSPVV